MAVVAGVVFFAVRALLALIPALTVGFNAEVGAIFLVLAVLAFYRFRPRYRSGDFYVR